MKNLKTTSSDGVEISYTQYGKGRDLILFVHGWSCNQTYWREQIDFFKDRFTVITVDLGGHGKSGTNRGDYTIQAFGNDVTAVALQSEYENLYLVGHSMGAKVILDAAAKIKGNNIKLFLVDQIKRKYWPVADETLQVFLKPFRENFKTYTKHFVITGHNFTPQSNPELIEWISDDMSNTEPWIAISSIYNLFIRDFDETILELNRRGIRMYLINSEESKSEDKSLLACMGFKIEVIPDTGHFLMMENPELFNPKLLELIQNALS